MPIFKVGFNELVRVTEEIEADSILKAVYIAMNKDRTRTPLKGSVVSRYGWSSAEPKFVNERHKKGDNYV